MLILDEVHRTPAIFAPLRGIIDERRRAGSRAGQFLLPGSASIELLKQSSETLAGRVALCELPPFTIGELVRDDLWRLWSRGGFPESFLADTDALRFEWRRGARISAAGRRLTHELRNVLCPDRIDGQALPVTAVALTGWQGLSPRLSANR